MHSSKRYLRGDLTDQAVVFLLLAKGLLEIGAMCAQCTCPRAKEIGQVPRLCGLHLVGIGENVNR